MLAIAGLVVSLLALAVARWGRSAGHT